MDWVVPVAAEEVRQRGVVEVEAEDVRERGGGLDLVVVSLTNGEHSLQFKRPHEGATAFGLFPFLYQRSCVSGAQLFGHLNNVFFSHFLPLAKKNVCRMAILTI